MYFAHNSLIKVNHLQNYFYFYMEMSYVHELLL